MSPGQSVGTVEGCTRPPRLSSDSQCGGQGQEPSRRLHSLRRGWPRWACLWEEGKTLSGLPQSPPRAPCSLQAKPGFSGSEQANLQGPSEGPENT